MHWYGTECTSNSTTWDSWLLDRKWATIPGTVGTRTSTRRTVATSSSTTVDSGYLDINYPGHLLPRPQLLWTNATWNSITLYSCYLDLNYLELLLLETHLPWRPQLPVTVVTLTSTIWGRGYLDLDSFSSFFSFFLDHFLGRKRVFLFFYFLVSFFKFPPQHSGVTIEVRTNFCCHSAESGWL